MENLDLKRERSQASALLLMSVSVRIARGTSGQPNGEGKKGLRQLGQGWLDEEQHKNALNVTLQNKQSYLMRDPLHSLRLRITV